MRKPNTTIITRLLTAALAIASLALAHGGFDHVRGTVVGVSNNVLTVKTSTSSVDVKLDDKTEISKAGQKATAADLKAGSRVVIDIPEGSKEKIAHSVQIGSAAAAAPAHSDHAH
jgi:uncharacterized cupredoxin-like copper-binding protein